MLPAHLTRAAEEAAKYDHQALVLKKQREELDKIEELKMVEFLAAKVVCRARAVGADVRRRSVSRRWRRTRSARRTSASWRLRGCWHCRSRRLTRWLSGRSHC